MRVFCGLLLLLACCAERTAPSRAPGAATFEDLGHGRFLGRGDGLLELSAGRIACKASGVSLLFPAVPPCAERPRGVFVHRFRSAEPVRSELCGAVRYAGVWPGVDFLVHSRGRRFEIDLEMAAGADWDAARLRFEGGEPRLEAGGALAVGSLRLRRPVVLQDGAAHDGWYRVARDGSVTFGCTSVDRTRPCTIDPVIVEVWTDDGGGYDSPMAMAIGPGGDLYVCGITTSPGWSTGSVPPGGDALSGLHDLFVGRYSPGGALKALAYLGGPDSDIAHDIHVDDDGRVYLTGTAGQGFPLAGNTVRDVHLSGGAAFVTVIAPDWSRLEYSTYLSAHSGRGIAVGDDGAIHVVGSVLRYPLNEPAPLVTTGSAVGDALDGYYVRLDSTGLIAGTLLGHGGDQEAVDLTLAADGTAWVLGSTNGASIPRIGPGGDQDIAVWRVDATTAALRSRIAIGGRGRDVPDSLDLYAGGRVALCGSASRDGYPELRNAVWGAEADPAAFVTVLEPDGVSLYYSTLLSQLAGARAEGIAEGPAGVLNVVGSASFQLVGDGGYLARIDPRITGRWSLFDHLPATDSFTFGPLALVRGDQTNWIMGERFATTFDLAVARIEDGVLPEFVDMELTAAAIHTDQRTKCSATLTVRNLGRSRSDPLRVEVEELVPGVTYAGGDFLHDAVRDRYFFEAPALDGATGESEQTVRIDVEIDPATLTRIPQLRFALAGRTRFDPDRSNDVATVPLYYRADLEISGHARRTSSAQDWPLRLELTNHGPDDAYDLSIRGIRISDGQGEFLASALSFPIGAEWDREKGDYLLPRLRAGESTTVNFLFDRTVRDDTEIDLSVFSRTPDGDPSNNGSTVRFIEPPPKPKRGSLCFIATAAYGSASDDDVATLRAFRDDRLLQSEPGRAFVGWYYEHSPPAADYIAERPFLRATTRFALGILVGLIRWPALAAALVAASALLLIRRRRRSALACLLVPMLLAGLLAL